MMLKITSKAILVS